MRRVLLRQVAYALVTISLGMSTMAALAQEEKKEAKPKESATTTQPKPASTYRVEFVVKEIEDGKKVNTRSYMMVVQEEDFGRLRVGNRVPYVAGEKQYQYTDVGMNIDCHVFERENGVMLNVSVESSSVVASEQTAGASINPVFRQQRTNLITAVTPGKPTVIAAMDDVVTNRRYEIEVTATKVK